MRWQNYEFHSRALALPLFSLSQKHTAREEGVPKLIEFEIFLLFHRTVQRMVSASTSSAGAVSTKHKATDVSGAEHGGFCGALQRFPPNTPAILTRRLANKENIGFGRVSCLSALCNRQQKAQKQKCVRHSIY